MSVVLVNLDTRSVLDDYKYDNERRAVWRMVEERHQYEGIKR